MAQKSSKSTPMRFKTVIQADVPHGRNGKHKQIVSMILEDLDRLKDGSALKLPLADLPDTKGNIRSALNRAGHKTGRKIATAADDNFLYVWNVTE
jgi:hypothetical protein